MTTNTLHPGHCGGNRNAAQVGPARRPANRKKVPRHRTGPGGRGEGSGPRSHARRRQGLDKTRARDFKPAVSDGDSREGAATSPRWRRLPGAQSPGTKPRHRLLRLCGGAGERAGLPLAPPPLSPVPRRAPLAGAGHAHPAPRRAGPSGGSARVRWGRPLGAPPPGAFGGRQSWAFSALPALRRWEARGRAAGARARARSLPSSVPRAVHAGGARPGLTALRLRS